MVQSTCPDWIAATRAEGSLMIWTVTRAIFALVSPIIVVALEHDARVQFVFGELAGTGADGAFQKVVEALAFNVVLGNDIAAEERQPLRHGRRRRTEFHRCLGRRLDDNVVHLSHGIGDVELEAGFVAFKERVARSHRSHLGLPSRDREGAVAGSGFPQIG